MRRIAIIVTAAAIVLAAAGAAYAASGPYTGSLSFASSKPGSSSKPVPSAFTLNVNANPTGANRPPIQLDLKFKIYGMKVDGKDFKTCSLSKIEAAHNDTVCPKKALFASGYIHALLGPTTNWATSAGFACDPGLDVWNSGQGKLTYFFFTNPTHLCGPLQTGGTPPYPGTYKMVGKYLEANTPVPNAINYPAAGLVGSLQSEHLVFHTQTSKGHISQALVGCKKGKRPYSITSTTTMPGSPNTVATISGSGKC